MTRTQRTQSAIRHLLTEGYTIVPPQSLKEAPTLARILAEVTAAKAGSASPAITKPAQEVKT
jgi:hypothetical protein